MLKTKIEGFDEVQEVLKEYREGGALELKQYRTIGTVEEVKRMQRYSALAKKHSTIGQVIDSCAEYEAIGTVEECREARERQIPKKLIHGGLYACPNCHTIMLQGAFEARGKCCKECGQAIDWSETV